MGAYIRSTALSMNGNIHSLIELAASAGEECLEKAGIDRDDVDLIISTGILRDNNIVEPAMATLIQKRLKINLTYTGGHNTTFSFDILNGACGLLNAAQAASAMLANGTIRNALIVSSDVHPSKSVVNDFPYSSIGSAMLLEWSDDPGKGFQNIEFKTSSCGYIGSKARIDINYHGIKAKESMTVQVEPDYTERLQAFTVEAIKHLLSLYQEKYGIDPDKIKLIATHLWKGFWKKVCKAAEIKDQSMECLYEKYGNPNSSALTVAYHDACSAGRLHEGDQVVFLAASSGLNVGVGLYYV